MRGFKKFLYAKNVKVIKLPNIKRLSLKEIISWAKGISNMTATCQHTVIINILIEIGSAVY